MTRHQTRHPLWLSALALALTFVFSGSSFSQETAADHVQPQVTRAQFTQLLKHLNLESDQRTIAELAFSDYSAAMSALIKATDESATKAGRQAVSDALGGKARLKPEELAALRVGVLNAYRASWPQADAAFDDLVLSVQSVLVGDQVPLFDEALRELRRAVHLHPRQREAEYHGYAGEGVDVIVLADQALESGGELESTGRGEIEPLLRNYELQMDALLAKTAAQHRALRLERKIAEIQKNQSQITQLEGQAVMLWKSLFELNRAAVQQIATKLDADSRQRWLDRFDHASFTWLYPRRLPDRQIEWMRREQVEPATLAKAEGLYAQYAAKRRTITRQAIDIMLQARVELQLALNPMDPAGIDGRGRELYTSLLKNSGEQSTLDGATASQLESLLTEQQREGLRQAMKRPDPQSRRR